MSSTRALASLSLFCVLLSQHPAHAQSSYTAAELQPAVNGNMTAVRGLDATGRAVGLSNVSRGLKWDILTGFYIKYDYIDVEWPASSKATRAVRLTPADFRPEAVNAAGTMVGLLGPAGAVKPVVMGRNGQVLHELPRAASFPAINAKAWVAGAVKSDTGLLQPAIWRDGQLTLLPMGNYQEGEALALNTQGQAVGYLLKTDQMGNEIGVPVRWTNGQIDWVGPEGAPPGPNTNIGARSNATTATGIDDAGRVLYRIHEPDGQGDRRIVSHLRNPDGGIVNPALPDGTPIFISAINGKGDALGFAGVRDSGGLPYLVKADGSVVDLAQWGRSGKIRLPSGAGTIQVCGALNDQGMMVCETKAWSLFGGATKYFRVMPD